jgi:hypothetical protein
MKAFQVSVRKMRKISEGGQQIFKENSFELQPRQINIG